jgi:integrase
MPLSDLQIRNAKSSAKPYKLADGGGLYVLVKPDGAKYWRLKYRFAGKEKLLALGVYPQVRPAEARAARDEAKRQLLAGRDPASERREEKRAALISAAATFEVIAREWVEQQRNRWTPDHAERVLDSLVTDVFPAIGFRPMAEITAPELLAVLRKIEARGALEVASRVYQRCGAVFRYAVATGRCERSPVGDLRGALKAPKREHRAALLAADLPEYLRTLEAYDGQLQTKLALKLLALTFVRTRELRGAEWSEFDLEHAEWRIPAERMKMRAAHIVPLSRQALAVLAQLKPLTGDQRFLFPNQHKPDACMSENTMLYALYRMGYHSRATGHGFRATASTILNEQGWRADAIERQLAHAEKNKVRAAYHRSEYLPERRKMMQAWAEHLDRLALSAAKTSSPKRLAAQSQHRALGSKLYRLDR